MLGVRIILALLNELRNPPSFLLIPWNKLNATGVTGSFGKTCLLNLWGLLSFLKWGRSMKIDNLDSLLHLSGLSVLFRVFLFPLKILGTESCYVYEEGS